MQAAEHIGQTSQIYITTFYTFYPQSVEQLELRKAQLEHRAECLGISGLVIFGQEGVNATIAGTRDAIEQYKELIRSWPGFEDTIFKDSQAETVPFRRFGVKVREEIVSLGRTDLYPGKKQNHHLSPEEWDRVLQEEDVIILDTRNDYEVALGKFKGAVDPNIKIFSEFAGFLDKQNYPKEKKVLMYCTGGIRCEKAILEMQSRGYNNVYQLEGGILNYFAQRPHSMFEGECYVFDHRVAVDQELSPSTKVKMCPHTGNPATEDVVCGNCGIETKVAVSCLEDAALQSCSKNCAYHIRRKQASKH